MKRFLLIVVVLLLQFVCVPGVNASSWPMAQHDASNSGFAADETAIEPPLFVRWSKGSEHSSLERRSRPVIADGVVYVRQSWMAFDGSDYRIPDGQISAISLSTGGTLWKLKNIVSSVTPVLANGRVYIATNDGRLISIVAATGSIAWSVDIETDALTPVASGHMLYVSTLSGKLYAIHAESGETEWVAQRSSNMSAPAVTNDAVFVGGGELTAFDLSNGHIKWTRNDLGYFGTPAVRESQVYVSSPRWVRCFNGETGAERWSCPQVFGDQYGALKTPALSDKNLYIGSAAALDLDTGALKWKFDAHSDYRFSSVAVANGFVFVGSRNSDRDSFDGEGRLYILREDTGELVWLHSSGMTFDDVAPIDPSPSIADNCVVLNLSPCILRCLAMSEVSTLRNVTLSKSTLNPYDPESGFVDCIFELSKDATATVEVLDYRAKPVRTLTTAERFSSGINSIAWYGLIDFPEMVDPDFRSRYGDKGVLFAPDGDYSLRVTALNKQGKAFAKSVAIKITGEAR